VWKGLYERETRMKRRGLWAAGVVLLVGVVAVLAVGTGFAKDENDGANKCSEATLHGKYLFAQDGVVIEGNDQVPLSFAGYQVYNGNGKMKGVLSENVNGEITRKPISGTYTVNADCTGTTTETDGVQYDQFIAPDGSMFTLIVTNPPEVVTSGFELRGTAKRVAE
jgi:hypothetical protein